MDLNLRPLSYDELCQMELLHVATSSNNDDRINLTTTSNITATTSTTTANLPFNDTSTGSNGIAPCATTATATALLPIMVIPTSILTSGGSVATNATTSDNYYAAYMPQAAFLLTPTPSQISTMSSTTSTSAAAAAVGAEATINTTTITNPMVTTTSCQQQQQQQQQKSQATINLSKFFENTTLPRRPSTTSFFVSNQQQQQQYVNNHVNMEESDFEGSECGASVSSASTCIPHFRFNACGMMLQPVQQHHAQQQQQGNCNDEAPNNLIGCGPFSHVMGSLGALQSSRLMGSLVGVAGSNGVSGTLGRNRRTCNMQQGSGGGGGSSISNNTGTQKRVSFKADLVPAEQIVNYGGSYCMDWTHAPNLRSGIMQQPASIAGPHMPTIPTANAFHNVGMHFDTFIDYQVR